MADPFSLSGPFPWVDEGDPSAEGARLAAAERLRRSVRMADEAGRTVTLTAAKDFGATSVGRLKEFYKRFGFVENKGRNYDPSISGTMYRPAKRSNQ